MWLVLLAWMMLSLLMLDKVVSSFRCGCGGHGGVHVVRKVGAEVGGESFKTCIRQIVYV